MANLPCPCNLAISGASHVVVRDQATGVAAEQIAIDRATDLAKADAQQAMTGFACDGDCELTWGAPSYVVRSSGAQTNPAFLIIGAATVVWTIYPRCAPRLIPVAPKPPAKPRPVSQTVSLTIPLGPASYPVRKTIACGDIDISISGPRTSPRDPEPGSIIFKFTPRRSELCDCEAFGWVQHVSRQGGPWRYDNGTQPGISSPQRHGAHSQPDQTVQPTNPPPGGDNPWYGAPSQPGAPADFDRDPTPQTTIGDLPDEAELSFVTQLVCVETGLVLFSWYWGPTGPAGTPLGGLPSGPTAPP